MLVTTEKPVIVDKPDCKLPTSLFLPPNPERKGEGGLRTKGYFKHSYKRVGKNWHICDTEGNPVFPCPLEVNAKILEYLQGLNEVDTTFGSGSITELPLITVVTVVKNAERWIEKTIASVVTQSYPNVEYIIIDGESVDETREILKKYDSFVDYWVSEPDTGIYDAMNKGTVLSTGQWILYLNAGDFLYADNVIERIFVSYFARRKENENDVALIYGDWVSFFSDYSFAFKPLPLKHLRTRMCFAHNACLFKVDVVKKYGYRTEHAISADYELLRWLYVKGLSFYYLQGLISCVNCEEGKSQTHLWTSFKERIIIASHQDGKHWILIFFQNFLREFLIAVLGKFFRIDFFGVKMSEKVRYWVRRLRYGSILWASERGKWPNQVNSAQVQSKNTRKVLCQR